ncbi:NUDIX hydrolase [Nonomuraea dietziae]|uniref:NUDIX hydrolase n=1 Tax=Nonomuraea dietziae TaxID=65515 RepID=UPI0031D30F4D
MTGTIDKIAWIHVADGKILSTRSRGKDVYYIPGGKREPGETDLDTLTREIDEELAITILPPPPGTSAPTRPRHTVTPTASPCG